MTTAQASTAHTSAARATAVHATTAAKPKRETFRIISTASSSRRLSLLGTGRYVAGGYVVPGKLVSGFATDRVVFPEGSFRMRRHVTVQHLPLPTSKCQVAETLRGTYTISHGTGVWRRVSGSGHFTLYITGVIRRQRNGLCGGKMAVYQAITRASGPIRR
jgi:hypothetical protein